MYIFLSEFLASSQNASAARTSRYHTLLFFSICSDSLSAMSPKFLVQRGEVIHHRSFWPWPLMGNVVLPWVLNYIGKEKVKDLIW